MLIVWEFFWTVRDWSPRPEQFTDLPPAGPIQPLRSWTYSFNLNLIGKDVLPIRQMDWPAPTAHAYPVQLRTWIGNVIRDEVQTPIGVQGTVTDLPPRAAEYPVTLRTWLQNLQQGTLARLPVGKQFYDVPPLGILQPLRSWLWSYNLNLIGQDRLPVGKQVTDLPPREHQRANDLRTWLTLVNLALTTEAGAVPFNQYDWPNPRGPAQPERTWLWKYNENLIAQDAFPVGARITDLPPLAQPSINDLRTWIDRVNLALTTASAVPFAQLDWPLPRTPEQPTQTWVSTFNRNLVGRDVLPIRQMDWPLTQIARQPDRFYSATYNSNLIGRDQFPPGARITDLPPTGHIYPSSLRTFTQSPAVEPVVPPPAADRHDMPFIATPGQLKSW